MSTEQEAKMVLPARNDALRIVPLHGQSEIQTPVHGAPTAVPAKLTFRNGPLLGAVEVFTIFWGASWQTASQQDLANNVNQFFDFILTSSLIDDLAEFSVPRQPIGHGKHIGTVTITTPRLKRTLTDSVIQHMLQQEISTNAIPTPNSNTLYFIYLPPGVSVSQGGSLSCQAFCGYHNDIQGQIFYAVMPFAGCQGCTGGLSVLDALTSTSSHELCEAITDPIPGRGWYDDNNGEIGDICAWQTKKIGNFMVQLEWSNQQNACI